jgi:GT2 family glycosyltransferase
MIYLIALNYNSSRLTIEFLESLTKVPTPYRLILVDNQSQDSDFERLSAYLKERFPEMEVSNEAQFTSDPQQRVLLIREPVNLGFAAGNNRGIRTALEQKDMEAVLLINNDTEVSPDFLEELLACRKAHPNVDLMGCRIFYAAAPDTLWYDGGRFYRHSTRSAHIHQDRTLKEVEASVLPHPTEFITGCCLYVSRACLDTIGLLDESLFMYNEDLEYCIRAQKAGLRLFHVPSAVIWHKVSSEPSPFSAYWGAKNRFRVSRLHASFSDRIFTFVFYILTRIPIFTRWLLAGKTSLILAQMKGFRDGLKP